MPLASARIAAASGVVFVILLVVGILLLDIPGHDDSDTIVNEFYASSGDRARVVASAYLLAGAGLALLVFLAFLRGYLKAIEGEPGTLSAIAFGAGLVFVVSLFALGAAQSPTYALSIDAFDEPQSELTRAVIPHLGYSMFIYGLWAAAAMIASTSLVILRSAAFARWMAWAGFAAAAVLVFGIFFMPIIALPLWVLAMSVELLRARSPVAPTVP
jgi:hypothetical protein